MHVCVYGDRETTKARERNAHSKRQADRQTNRQGQRQTHRQTDTERQADKRENHHLIIIIISPVPLAVVKETRKTMPW